MSIRRGIGALVSAAALAGLWVGAVPADAATPPPVTTVTITGSGFTVGGQRVTSLQVSPGAEVRWRNGTPLTTYSLDIDSGAWTNGGRPLLPGTTSAAWRPPSGTHQVVADPHPAGQRLAMTVAARAAGSPSPSGSAAAPTPTGSAAAPTPAGSAGPSPAGSAAPSASGTPGPSESAADLPAPSAKDPSLAPDPARGSPTASAAALPTRFDAAPPTVPDLPLPQRGATSKGSPAPGREPLVAAGLGAVGADGSPAGDGVRTAAAAAALHPAGGSGRRALGLTASIAAVLVVGVGGGLARVLLTEPLPVDNRRR